MVVTAYCINQGTPSQYFGLKNAEENTVLHCAPNNWKTEAGAKRWAQRNGFTVKEEKPKTRIEKATENFVAVRDHFLNEDRGTSRAFRLAWKKPMKFYGEHTPAEAVEILKREAEENVQ